MVAMAIGLFIVLIATTVYTQGVSNFSFRTGQSENLGNSRYALDTIEAAFTKAGYRRDPTQNMKLAFPANATAYKNGCQFAAGEAPRPGSEIGRQGSAPEGGPLTLTDPKLYDGSLAKKITIPNLPSKEPA